MTLCGIDESEITGDVLDRRVPHPGNRRMGGRHLPNAKREGAQYKMVFHFRDSRGGASIEPV
jgi:hypothetical protein